MTVASAARAEAGIGVRRAGAIARRLARENGVAAANVASFSGDDRRKRPVRCSRAHRRSRLIY